MLTRCNFTMYNTFDMKMTFFICKVLAFVMHNFVNFIYCVEGGRGGGRNHGSKSQNGLQTFISW